MRIGPGEQPIRPRDIVQFGKVALIIEVNEATPEGLPVLFVQDIPPVSTTRDLKVTQPAIYYGELSSDEVRRACLRSEARSRP